MGNAEPYHVEAQYDWNGDGTPDHFRLRVQKEVAPLVEGLEQTPAGNQHWSYHCWLVVDSGFDQSTLWEDEWSVRESDLVSFQEIVNFGTADEFFRPALFSKSTPLPMVKSRLHQRPEYLSSFQGSPYA